MDDLFDVVPDFCDEDCMGGLGGVLPLILAVGCCLCSCLGLGGGLLGSGLGRRRRRSHNRRRTTRRWRTEKEPTRKPRITRRERIRMEVVDDITWIDNDIVDLDNIMDNDDKFINDTYETLTDPLLDRLDSVNPGTGSAITDLGKMLPEYATNGNLSIWSSNVSNNILV
ncbi:hypothetical protein M8J75_013058 [Diaphorina citri]|nr:hypothetical protein M8J75_013058 [Diaphorina citri]